MKQDCSAAGAREIYKLRPYKNFALGLMVFLPIVGLLLLFFNAWVAGAIALLPALGLYFFLESRVLMIQCPKCGKDIDTNTPWLCGFKSCRNENVDHQHPFIHECEHCQYPPKAYECHHCHEPIYLTTDRQQIHMAKFLVGLEPVLPKPRDAWSEKFSTQYEEVRDLEHQLKKTTLEKKIEIEKNKPVSTVVKSAEQALENEIEECVNQRMSLYAIEQRLKEKANTEFADDEHKLQQKHALIERMIGDRLE